MNKEEITFNTDEDIIFQIEMMSYDKYNYKIASANDHIGDIYSYRDIEDMKSAETQYEKELSYIAIKQLQQENKKIKEKFVNAVTDYETEKSKNVKAVKEIEKELKENNHLSYGVSLAIITILNGGLVIKGE